MGMERKTWRYNFRTIEKLGASCDWDRTTFTMDDNYYKSVIHIFVDLYNKGLIYRSHRMVNWDPQALTALSDEEVIYKNLIANYIISNII